MSDANRDILEISAIYGNGSSMNVRVDFVGRL